MPTQSRQQTVHSIPACVKCKEENPANYELCGLCEQLFCQECTGHSADFLRDLKKFDYDFNCPSCKKIKKKIFNRLDRVELSVKDFKASCEQKFSELSEKIENLSAGNASASVPPPSMTGVIEEATLRLSNKCWLVLGNVPEQPSGLQSEETVQRDSDEVKKVLDYLLPEMDCYPELESAQRFPPRKSAQPERGRPRLLKFKVKDTSIVGKILKAKKNLSRNPEFSKYSLNPLLTPTQMKDQKLAHAEWKERKGRGENVVIYRGKCLLRRELTGRQAAPEPFLEEQK